MNMGDAINDFLCDVRERGGFANDRDFDLIVGQVFSEKIKAHIKAERDACAEIADAWVWPSTRGEKPDSDLSSRVAAKIARKIRARSEDEKRD